MRRRRRWPGKTDLHHELLPLPLLVLRQGEHPPAEQHQVQPHLHWPVHSASTTLHSASTSLHCALCTVHCTLYSVHCTLHCPHLHLALGCRVAALISVQHLQHSVHHFTISPFHYFTIPPFHHSCTISPFHHSTIPAPGLWQHHLGPADRPAAHRLHAEGGGRAREGDPPPPPPLPPPLPLPSSLQEDVCPRGGI